MSELCDSSKCQFSSLLISDLVLLCSFTLSHPLYFSYFIFFSPYLLRLLSFLSPLFITTFLLSLAFLSGFVHENFSTELAKCGYDSVLEKLRFKKGHLDDELLSADDLGVYEILFGSPVMEEKESAVVFMEGKPKEDICSEKIVELADSKVELETSSTSLDQLKNSGGEMEEKRLENFLKILDEFERIASGAEEKKKLEASRGAKSDKAAEKHKAATMLSNGSEAATAFNKINGAANVDVNGGKEGSSIVNGHSQRFTTTTAIKTDHDDRKSTLKAESSRALLEANSYGSMRKEKEWKRTLACKLFEERHNVDGGEGMDSLWEAYEMDSNKPVKQKKDEEKKKKKIKSRNKKREDIDEEEEVVGLCCLQALKLSAGKMNLGMGRPNLLKISKAIKGIGWLHHASKKVHSNGDRY